jgi:peptidoglycan-associated lipoprotein
MNRQIAMLTLCGTLAVIVTGCATKGFVREQVTSSEARLGQRVDTQDTKMREASDLAATNRQAIEAANQRLQGFDSRLGEVGTLAADAKKGADSVAEGLRETDARLSQHLANRNKYAMLEMKSVYFRFGRATLGDEGINELEEIARALKADPNAVVELQGFADPRGSDRYNYQLSRERVDAVVRHLVQRHGIELRRIHAVGMGKVSRAGHEAAARDFYAKSRRVDVRLLAPQS